MVDEGIAPLVEALSACLDVLTVDSCQERPDGSASVYFTFHGDPDDVPSRAHALAKRIEAPCPYTLAVEYFMGGTPLVRLTTASGDVAALTASVRRCADVTGLAQNLAV